VSCHVFPNLSITKDKGHTKKQKAKMSIRTQLDDVVTQNAIQAAESTNVVPVRALTARKAGAGPTSALGVESSAVTQAGALVVTATNGLVVPPVYLGVITSAQSGAMNTRATALPITKSGATHFIQADPVENLYLRLPAAASSAGFKVKFVSLATATTSSTVSIYTASVDTTLTNRFYNFIGNLRQAANAASVGAATRTLLVVTTWPVGDVLEFECDGYNWVVSGYVASGATLVFSTPSA
jgi:hypothetical protein